MEHSAKMDRDGRITLPKAMRDALSLAHGTRISLCQEGERLLITRVEDHAQSAGAPERKC
ncbi:AbrB/MazE/SpoVT family DNA-binding domain-containing protein [Granulicella rosea]|uniref:AbrB/MazE/SpoVT family DNA-binding domain-containing protein n=1 Tax=Granulicella rosea TaxID=474952 RepID=UPI003CCB7725